MEAHSPGELHMNKTFLNSLTNIKRKNTISNLIVIVVYTKIK